MIFAVVWLFGFVFLVLLMWHMLWAGIRAFFQWVNPHESPIPTFDPAEPPKGPLPVGPPSTWTPEERARMYWEVNLSWRSRPVRH
jgi:hypothetical protein